MALSSSFPLLPQSSPFPELLGDMNEELQLQQTFPSTPPHWKFSEEMNSDKLSVFKDVTKRKSSPDPSTISDLSCLTATPPPTALDGSAETKQPPAKRRKLTPAEKEAREREHTEKTAKRLEDKAKRDGEKRKRDEDRRVKNEMLEEKRRDKEFKKQVKEQKKRLEEEEKIKKERAQSRINSFFPKPPLSGKDNSSPRTISAWSLTPDRSQQGEKSCLPDVTTTPSKPPRTLSDYQKTFLPFAAPHNLTVAPSNHYTWDAKATRCAFRNANDWMTHEYHPSETNPSLDQCLQLSPIDKVPRGRDFTATSAIMWKLYEETNILDLTRDEPARDPRSLLKSLPMKYIFFHEDVRPPYVGTMSKCQDAAGLRCIGRRPTEMLRQELDYDYDSEAEWEEPEGEDLGSDGDDDEESMGDADELAEFLDDEGAEDMRKSKPKHMNGEMIPFSTGICWEDKQGRQKNTAKTLPIDPSDFRLESLVSYATLPIDPFSCAYWLSSGSAVDSISIPLQAHPSAATDGEQVTNKDSTKVGKPPKQGRLLEGQTLEEFKQIVNGSDLTKQGIMAVAKKKMPKVPKVVLSDTLGTIAARVGAKEADKRWVIVQEEI